MQFTYYWPLWGVLLGIFVAMGITLYGYRRIGRPFPLLLRGTLISLRFISIAILLCCLLAPVLIEKKEMTPIPHCAILVDTSQSMLIKDNYQGPSDTSRMQQVNQLLSSESHPFLPTLRHAYKVHLYAFDTTLHPNTSPATPFEPTGTLTNIATTLRDTVSLLRGHPTAGIVLITDGAHNASPFSVEDIALLKTPVYTIGVGSPQPPKDIHIQNVDVPPIAYTDHENVIRVSILQTGYASESVSVSLQETETHRFIDTALLIFANTHPAPSIPWKGQQLLKGTRHEVELKWTPPTEGHYQYQVTIPTREGELTHANNESTFSIKAIKAKLNVFYLEGRPRWEYAFLKRTLERDPHIEAACAVLSQKVRSDSVPAQNDGYYPQPPETPTVQFPETRDALFKYDILILGDLSAKQLTPAQHQAIVDFVDIRGKAVIFLPSYQAFGTQGIQNTPISQILPIRIPANGCRKVEGEFSMALTQTGAFHPILHLTDEVERNRHLWQNLPPLSRIFRDYQLRAGATTLLKNQHEHPILIFQRVGLGKCLLLTAEGLWNWQFGVHAFKNNTDPTLYSRFWAHMLRWMSPQTDENNLSLTTASPAYALGETAQIQVSVSSHMLQTQANADIQLTVTTPKGTTLPLPSHRTPIDPQGHPSRRWTAQWKVEEKGTYRIRATGKVGNIDLGEAEREIVVHPQPLEWETPQLNEPLLKQLAEQTGGAFLTIEDAPKLPEQIKTAQNPIFIETEQDIWAHPLILIAVVGLLGTEWFLRKRNGFV